MMELFWTTASVASLVGVSVLSALLLFLTQEVGTILARIGPSYAKPLDHGPELGSTLLQLGPNIGDRLAAMPGFQSDLSLPVSSARRDPRSVLLIFTTSTCSHCLEILARLPVFIRDYRKTCRVNIINKGAIQPDATPWKEVRDNLTPVDDPAKLAEDLHVHTFPFGVLMTPDGRVLSRGITNTIAQVESLFSVDLVKAPNFPLPLPDADHDQTEVPIP